jgi:hypothetical protein
MTYSHTIQDKCDCPAQIVADAYPSGNFHRVYYGEILAVRAEENARALLELE